MKAMLYLYTFVICLIVNYSSAFEHGQSREIKTPRNTETIKTKGFTEIRSYPEGRENTETKSISEEIENLEKHTNVETRRFQKELHYPQRKVRAPGIEETRVTTEMQGIPETRRNTGSVRYPGRDSENTETEFDPIVADKMVQAIASHMRVLVPKVTDSLANMIEALSGIFTKQKPAQTVCTRFGGCEQRQTTLTTAEAPRKKELTEDNLRGLIAHYQEQLIAVTSAKNVAQANTAPKLQTHLVV